MFYGVSLRRFARSLLVCCGALIFSTQSMAAAGIVKGQVEYIRSHSASQYSAWAPPMFWFTLKDVAAAGACPVWNGKVLFAMSSKDALSIVLSAQMSGQEIAVSYDDSKQINSKCEAGYLTLGNPAPLF